MKGLLGSMKITLANIYAPNTHQCMFISEICNDLKAFREGITVLGGNINVSLCQLLDSSTGSTSIPYRALRRLKTDISSLALSSNVAFATPDVKDFTHYSHTQDKYASLNYFFLSQPDLPLIDSTTIEPMVISNHHPITMTITLWEREDRTKIWRYDPTFFSDPLTLQQIQSFVNLYFKENTTTDVSPLTTWEAHKCVLRGELMQSEHQQQIRDLLAEINILERTQTNQSPRHPPKINDNT